MHSLNCDPVAHHQLSLQPLYFPLLLPPHAHLPHPALLLLSPPLVLQIPRLQPLQLLGNLLALVRYLVRLARLRPELGDCEFAVEVRAEVVHYADGEENVHAELK
jgi:hypothetical protein